MSLWISIALNTQQPPSVAAELLSITGQIDEDGHVTGPTPGGSFLTARRSRETYWDIPRDVFGIDHTVTIRGDINKDSPTDEVLNIIRQIPSLYEISKDGGYIQYLDNPMVRWTDQTIEVSRSHFYADDIRTTLFNAQLGDRIVDVDFDQL